MSDDDEYDFLILDNGRVNSDGRFIRDKVGDTILKDWKDLSAENKVKPVTSTDIKWVRSRTAKKNP